MLALAVLAADGGLSVLIGLGFVAVIIWWVVALVSNEKRRKAWVEVAGRLGLTLVKPDHLIGELDGSNVVVDIITRGSGKNRRTYTRVCASGGLPDDLTLAREGFFSSFTSDHETGDKRFDSAVRVKGDEGLALAVLDEPIRAIVANATLEGWVYQGGIWLYEVQRRLGAEIEDKLRSGAALAQTLRGAAQSVAQRLAARVTSDPDTGARRRVLEYLIEHYRDTEALRRALDAARSDVDATVRFIAARELVDLEVLAAIARDRELPGQLRADALRAACAMRKHPTTLQLIDDLPAELSEETTAPALRLALAWALGVVPNARAEATLIDLLESKGDEVQLEAIRSLGNVGTVAAVPALIPFRDRFMAFAMQSAGVAKDAILQIQSRAGHAAAGALALAEVEGGLALAADESPANPSEHAASEPAET